ncbi:hypothetical protein F4703DRAFT_1862313 [Phycomyces blakesleeanus]
MVHEQLLDSLNARLSAHSRTFETLLQLIPTNYLTVKQEKAHNESKYMHNKRKRQSEHALRHAQKKRKRSKAEKLWAEETDASTDVDCDTASVASSVASSITSSVASSVNSCDFDPFDQNFNACKHTMTLPMAVQADILQPMRNKDTTELRNQLHQRIVALRQKRNAPGSDTPKARSREEVLAKQLKWKEDQKRIKAEKSKARALALLYKPIQLTRTTLSSVSQPPKDSTIDVKPSNSVPTNTLHTKDTSSIKDPLATNSNIKDLPLTKETLKNIHKVEHGFSTKEILPHPKQDNPKRHFGPKSSSDHKKKQKGGRAGFEGAVRRKTEKQRKQKKQSL